MRRAKLEDGRDYLLWQDGLFAAEKQKAAHLKAGIIHGVASTDQVDRDGERIAEGAFDKSIDAFMQNPVLLWAHEHKIPAIGKVIDFSRNANRYDFDAEFAIGVGGEEGKFFGSPPARPDPGLLHALYSRGYMRAFSVGFIPDSWSDSKDLRHEGQTGDTFTEAQMIELSCCNVPSNPGALANAFGATSKALGLERYMGAPVAPHRPAKAMAGQTDSAYHGGAWRDPSADLDLYKHHLMDGRVEFRGVVGAMTALLAGDGDIPEGDRPGVYEHLATHYQQFDREPPPFERDKLERLVARGLADVLAVAELNTAETAPSEREQAFSKALLDAAALVR